MRAQESGDEVRRTRAADFLISPLSQSRPELYARLEKAREELAKQQ